MKKMTGKTSAKRENYLSFMFVPHNTGTVKTFRINNYRTTLLSATAILLVALLMLTGYTLSVVNENKTLKSQHAEELQDILAQKTQLEDYIANQTKQLIANTELITEASSTRAKTDETISQIKTEYEDMVVAYVDNNMKTVKTVSRGSSSGTTFKQNLTDLRGLIDILKTAKLSEDDVTSQIAKKQTELTNYLDTLPTKWPLDKVVSVDSDFGRRFHPIYKRYINHDGIDIGNTKNSPIYAAGAGKVIHSGWNGGYGNCVIIDHGNGFKSVYGHMNSCLVKVGDWVKKGQKIGKMGSTGTSTGTHLHFELRVNDVPTDPKKYLEY